jgi:hypothetical protein
MGSKVQRQNQHLRRLMMKKTRHEKRGWNTDGLTREIAYVSGEKERPAHNTGRVADERMKRYTSSDD